MEVDSALRPPSVADYADYRRFLGDLYDYKKKSNRRFSYRRFSQLVGLRSPNYIQLVIQGKRNVTEETAARIAKVLKLSPIEQDYFLALVRVENAQNDKDRREAQKWRLISIKRLLAKRIDQSQLKVFDKWYYFVVRELVCLDDFEPTGTYITKRLAHLISEDEAEGALRVLLEAGFLELKEGRWRQVDPVLSTDDSDFWHEQLLKLHQDTLRLWAAKLKEMDHREQETHLLNVPISEAKIPELKQKIRQFQEELIGWLQEEEQPDRVIQIGTYMFPFPR